MLLHRVKGRQSPATLRSLTLTSVLTHSDNSGHMAALRSAQTQPFYVGEFRCIMGYMMTLLLLSIKRKREKGWASFIRKTLYDIAVGFRKVVK